MIVMQKTLRELLNLVVLLQVIDWLVLNTKKVLERVEACDPLVEECKYKWVKAYK